MNWKNLFIFYLFTSLIVHVAYSQPISQSKFPPDIDLVDNKYYEGFRQYKNVSAGKIKLISCLALYSSNCPTDTSQFKIDFYIPDNFNNEEIDFFIEDRGEKIYYMIPVQDNWPSGNHTFSWNSQKAGENNIGLHDLFGIAMFKKYDFARYIIPITLYYSQQPTQIKEYEFVFVSSRRANLRYKIYDVSLNIIESGTINNQPSNTDIIIKWDCINEASGKYILEIKYNLKNGNPKTGVNIYEFYHKNRENNEID